MDRDIASLRAQAARCRRLAAGIGDRQAVIALTAMAEEYDARASAASDEFGYGAPLHDADEEGLDDGPAPTAKH